MHKRTSDRGVIEAKSKKLRVTAARVRSRGLCSYVCVRWLMFTHGARHEKETTLEETRVWIGGRKLRNSETLTPEVRKWVYYEDVHYGASL